MKLNILLTGANGYIGKRILPVLTEEGHSVVCCVRNKKRLPDSGIYKDEKVQIFEIDFLDDSLPKIENIHDIDVAYYFLHSMSSEDKEFAQLEEKTAKNFIKLATILKVKQIIYLSGIVNESELSSHLKSRKRVEDVLKSGEIPVTVLRAGIIVGSGSASFEIIRDLVEKLPVMITPKWLNTRHQPIAIRDVIKFLTGVILKTETYGKSYDIGGPDILTYKEMLLIFSNVRGLKRLILTVPVMTPKLSSYWLFFVTSTSYRLAQNLVDSMKIPVICRNNDLGELLKIETVSYRRAVEFAFEKIEQNMVISSWKDSLVSSVKDPGLLKHINVPKFGCFVDNRRAEISSEPDQVLENVWSIGGDRGWYYANFLWSIRGILDKIVGGVGLRRGRTHPSKINAGDTLDFWRVLISDLSEKRLLLFAEMKLPGDAWLEFKIEEKEGKIYLIQTATFRPKGIKGRLYWYSVLPFHHFIFNGMVRNIINFRPANKD
ncbi:MAG: SDR family oxidoreductase [Ignavibacteriaceae bacterium]|nr:SDR family oxidoreductase [Ignavibacteriaceae bacterium]